MTQDIFNYPYTSGMPGPHLLVFGAIHGNEVCGPYAIHHLASLFEKKFLTLKSGSLTMIPVCNEKGFENGTRFFEKDLNRVFKKHADPKYYEEKIANILTGYVDNCDYLLDLHSQTSDGAAFIFQDYDDPASSAFAKVLGASLIIKGWPNLYKDNPQLNEGDTTTYAYSKEKIGLVLECGQHKDPYAPAIAYNAIINSLIHLGMIDPPASPQIKLAAQVVVASELIVKPDNDSYLVSQWKHLEQFEAGQVLAIDGQGEKIIAQQKGVVILPKHNAQAKQEWFYLGYNEPG